MEGSHTRRGYHMRSVQKLVAFILIPELVSQGPGVKICGFLTPCVLFITLLTWHSVFTSVTLTILGNSCLISQCVNCLYILRRILRFFFRERQILSPSVFLDSFPISIGKKGDALPALKNLSYNKWHIPTIVLG